MEAAITNLICLLENTYCAVKESLVPCLLAERESSASAPIRREKGLFRQKGGLQDKRILHRCWFCRCCVVGDRPRTKETSGKITSRYWHYEIPQRHGCRMDEAMKAVPGETPDVEMAMETKGSNRSGRRPRWPERDKPLT
jgi:hypothetical protein